MRLNFLCLWRIEPTYSQPIKHEEIKVSIFLTMKATIFDKHGSKLRLYWPNLWSALYLFLSLFLFLPFLLLENENAVHMILIESKQSWAILHVIIVFVYSGSQSFHVHQPCQTGGPIRNYHYTKIQLFSIFLTFFT